MPRTHQEEAVDLVAKASVVANSTHADSTKHTYHQKLVTLIIFMFEQEYKNVLNPSMVEALEIAHVMDRRRRSMSRIQCRKVILKYLSNLNVDDHSRSPIKIGANDDERDVLTYDIIANFFDTKSKEVSVNRSLAVKFQKKLKDMMKADDGVEEETVIDIPPADENGEVRVKLRLEAGNYDGYRSAVSYIYRESGKEMPKHMSIRLARYIKGSQRVNLAAKQILGLSVTEGKSHMTVPVYELIAKKIFSSDKPELIMAHAFFTLDWNLMKRAENVVDAKISHIRWENDCLVFHFAKSKGHQEGSEEFLGPWHVYSNPLKPWLCPVLSLARYLFTFPNSLRGKSALFEGSDVYSRYAKNFTAVLYELKDELEELGVHPQDLGTHSGRKGVGTLVAAGCTVAPPIVSICLRMGWALGSVLGRYFKRGDAGDQHCGRCAALIDPLSMNFAVSCAYFDTSDLSEREQCEFNADLWKWLNERLPPEITAQAKRLILFLFAAVCKHHDYLDQSINHNSIFRTSPFFKDIPPRFKNAARIAFPWDKTAHTPVFTGVPPHVTILAQNEEIKKEIKQLRVEFQFIVPRVIGDEFDERGIGTTEFYTRRLEEMIAKLQESHDSMLKTLNEERTRHINATIESSMFESRFEPGLVYDVTEETLLGGDEELCVTEEGEGQGDRGYSTADNIGTTRQRREASGITEESVLAKRRKVVVGLVADTVTPLQANFEFPSSMTCSQLVCNWFIGDATRRILPYRRLRRHHFRHRDKKKEKAQRDRRQKMGRFMAVVEYYARAEKKWMGKNDEVTMQKVNELWNAIEWKHILSKYGLRDRSRSTTKSWVSVYNDMLKSGAFKKNRGQCKDDEEWKLSIYNDRSHQEIQNDDRSHLRPANDDDDGDEAEEEEEIHISTSIVGH